MVKLRIGYFADVPWSHLAFERMIQNEQIKIDFIAPRTSSADNILKSYSIKYNIPYHKGVKVNSDSFYRLAKSYNCDLFVSMSFNQIFRKKSFPYPNLK